MKRFIAIPVIFVFLLFGLFLPALAQQTPNVSTERIRGGVYLVKGGAGANTAFFSDGKEVLAIDAKMTEEAARQMIGEIKKVTPLPLTRMVISHSDRDHVNGLPGFPLGLTIISHENARRDMDKDFTTPASRARLPGLTYSGRLTLYLGEGNLVKAELLYFGPAHTDGDTVVYFPAEKVAFVGDLIFTQRDQIIHLHKKGSASGLVRVLGAILDLDADIFLSGHNDPLTRADIKNHRESILEKQTRVRMFVREGKGLDEVKKAFNITGPPSDPNAFRWPSLVEAIYREETGKK